MLIQSFFIPIKGGYRGKAILKKRTCLQERTVMGSFETWQEKKIIHLVVFTKNVTVCSQYSCWQFILWLCFGVDSCLVLHVTLHVACVVSLLFAPEDVSCEFGSSKYYALCGFGGILSCGITHTAVVPLDLVKCRLQVCMELSCLFTRTLGFR